MEHPWDARVRKQTQQSRAEERIRLMVGANMRQPKLAVVPMTTTVAQSAPALDLDRLQALLLEMPPIAKGPVILTAAEMAKLKAISVEQAREELGTFGLTVMEPDLVVKAAIDQVMPGATPEAKEFALKWWMAAMVNPVSGPPFPRGRLRE